MKIRNQKSREIRTLRKELNPDVDQITAEVQAKFFDEDGNEFHPHGDEFTLKVDPKHIHCDKWDVIED